MNVYRCQFSYSQKERLKYQKDYMESVKKLEEQLMIQLKNENSHMTSSEEVVIFYF